MYEGTKSVLLGLVRVPPEPHDPMGDVQSLRVFRAAPGYLRYITVGWAITQAALLLGTLVVLVPSLILGPGGPAGILVAAVAVLVALCLLIQTIGRMKALSFTESTSSDAAPPG